MDCYGRSGLRFGHNGVGLGRPRDRHTRASLGVVDLEARPCPPDPPAPSTPSVLVSLRLDRPGPAAAHGHRSPALMFRCITKFSDTVVMCTRASYLWLVLLFRMWASYLEPGTSLPHVNPLIGASARLPTCGSAGLRAGQRVCVRISDASVHARP